MFFDLAAGMVFPAEVLHGGLVLVEAGASPYPTIDHRGSTLKIFSAISRREA